MNVCPDIGLYGRQSRLCRLYCSNSGNVVLAVIILLLLWMPAKLFADTNVFSPTVSYTYSDAAAVSAVLSYDYLDAAGISPVVSYNYLDGIGISPVVSYQYNEWPGNDVLSLQYSPTVSYYYQFLTSSGSAILHGRITDIDGVPIPNASVEVSIGMSPLALVNADNNGNYQVPSIGSSGAYCLLAVAPSYQGELRALTLNANTAQQDFQLKPLPPTPAVQQVNRQPTLNFTTGPLGATLKVFNGTQFIPVNANNILPTDRMTIVLTHGWIPLIPLTGAPLFTVNGIDDWPITMATALRANGIAPDIANIVAWDWRTAASGIVPPQMNSPSQGVALGTNLLAALGINYSYPVHFLGHSLGTMVNAAAINFLHGERIPSTHTDVPIAHWPIDGEPFIHVTLFDEAADVTEGTAASQITFDGNTVRQTSSSVLLSADNNSTLNYSPPLPLHYTWADNYVGLVGFYEAKIVNVLLQQALIRQPLNAHGYPQNWYAQSVANPVDANNPLGFQNSFEYIQKNHLPLSNIPPFGLNDAYAQNTLSDELSLSPILLEGETTIDVYGSGAAGAANLLLTGSGETASVVVTTINGAAQIVGDVETTIEDETQQADQRISQGFNYVSSAAAQGQQSVINVINSSASLGLYLTSRLGAPNPFVNNLLRAKGIPNSSNLTNTPAMAWMSFTFPANAAGMAFDFTVSGNPMNDVLVCGIGTNILFSLEAKYIPTNTISSSSLLDVSQWLGATNELFFGLLGGTSTNATLEIDNIRFYSLPQPSLSAQCVGNAIVLSWPLSAQNFTLQTTTNLADPNSWTTLTNVPAIVNLQNTITNSISGSQGFYRLIQSQ